MPLSESLTYSESSEEIFGRVFYRNQSIDMNNEYRGLSTAFVIKYSLLKQSLERALLKHNSTMPDSLGDRIFRMVLKMSLIQTKYRARMVPVLYEALGLFKLHEREVAHV